ncbi:MAG: DUF1820 family protein [Coxiellaceae bacterium]|nr:DUF1820 family protein [Coxiellaceae bacterium]
MSNSSSNNNNNNNDTSDLMYKVVFTQFEKVYEVYAKYISEDTLMGFIEVDELVFSDTSTVVVDPAEEKLKLEFKGVKRSYIPMHAILRIDEVRDQGAARIRDKEGQNTNVAHIHGGGFDPEASSKQNK